MTFVGPILGLLLLGFALIGAKLMCDDAGYEGREYVFRYLAWVLCIVFVVSTVGKWAYLGALALGIGPAFWTTITSSSTAWLAMFGFTVVYVVGKFDGNTMPHQCVKAILCLLISLALAFAIVLGDWTLFMGIWGFVYLMCLILSSQTLFITCGIGAIVGVLIARK